MQTTIHGSAVAAAYPVREVPARATLRQHGEMFAERFHSAVNEVLHRHRPMPGGQLTRDLLRGRSATLATYGAVLAAIAYEQPSEVALIFASGSAWLHGVRPMPEGALRQAALRESKEQGEADVALWAAVDAVERGDRPALERLRTETAEHLVALQELLAVIEHECARLTTPTPRYRVVSTSRLVAAGARA